MRTTTQNFIRISLMVFFFCNTFFSFCQISTRHLSSYDGVGFADGQLIPQSYEMDQLNYTGFRYHELGAVTGVYFNASSISTDISKTAVKISSSDGSDFAFKRVDYTLDAGGSVKNVHVTFYGFKNGTQRVFQDFTLLDGTKGAFVMDDPAWEEIDEIRITSNTQWVFLDNLSIGPVQVKKKGLTYFGYKCKPSSTQLIWQTATEENNSHFIVQRMNDYGEFEDITSVEGAGNSTSLRIYRYSDTRVSEGACYKLVLISFDGTRTESTLLYTDNCTQVKNKVLVKSNLIELSYHISEDESMDYSIVSGSGNEVESGFVELKPNENRVAIFNYDETLAGVYYIHVVSNSLNIFERVYLK